ncbi:hypothetical protein V1478_006803 [Vespula squamosa]|uniref:Uncharacterized protein n=1 Tax=Vespula squamosa TaxID=30214 RepID=A0ABD2B152_VESSQ
MALLTGGHLNGQWVGWPAFCARPRGGGALSGRGTEVGASVGVGVGAGPGDEAGGGGGGGGGDGEGRTGGGEALDARHRSSWDSLGIVFLTRNRTSVTSETTTQRRRRLRTTEMPIICRKWPISWCTESNKNAKLEKEKREGSISGRPFECFRDSEGRQVLSVSSELNEYTRYSNSTGTSTNNNSGSINEKGRPAWKLAFSGALKVSNAFYAACTPLSALTASYEYGAGFLSALNMRL